MEFAEKNPGTDIDMARNSKPELLLNQNRISMKKWRSGHFTALFFLAFAVLISGCERTVEEEVVQPIEAIYSRKGAASLEAAAANVRMVRASLMRYPATSPDNLYPTDTVIVDYESLREVLTDANLPPDMAQLMWDPFHGIRYMSDGYTFTFEVRALSGSRAITATPNGLTVEE